MELANMEDLKSLQRHKKKVFDAELYTIRGSLDIVLKRGVFERGQTSPSADIP